MRTQVFKVNFMLVLSIFLIGFLNGCTSPPSVWQNQYWFDLRDGRRTVYTPIDSLVVLEFYDTLSATQKRKIIAELKLTILPIPIRTNQDIQTINKTTLVLGVSTAHYDTIKKKITQNYYNDLRGVLPAFELDKRLCYLRPTTFGISFYGDVHQDSVSTLLKKYELTLHDKAKIKASPYPFYMMRLAYVDTRSHTNLFAIIRGIFKEPEVYSAFPLFVESGYALVHGPSPIAIRQKLIRNEPPFWAKVESKLKDLYWVWKTSSFEIVNKFAYMSGVETVNDSVKVGIVLNINKNNSELIYDWLTEKGVHWLYPIKRVNDKSKVVAFISWQDFENIARSDNIWHISIN